MEMGSVDDRNLVHSAARAFQRHFGQSSIVCGYAPGRVEILGNHTDYNGGAVLAAAIDRHVVVVGRRRTDRQVRVVSATLDGQASFDLDEITPTATAEWSHYVQGVFGVLQSAGCELGGAELAIDSSVPAGAGVSSSAALTSAIAMAIQQLYPFELSRLDLARLLRRAEHEYAGVHCGLLDPFTVLHGADGQFVLLDCADDSHVLAPLPQPAPAVVLCQSGVERRLGADAPYNLRRGECEQALAACNEHLGEAFPALCAVPLASFREIAERIQDTPRKRAAHVLEEHARVFAARDALRRAELGQLGTLLFESHVSSQTQFENSCPELDRLLRIGQQHAGLIGGRLCGAGWGGCMLFVVQADQVEDFCAHMQKVAHVAEGALHVCQVCDGASGRHLS